MKFDDKKGIQSTESTWSVLYSELKARILSHIEGKNKGQKTKEQ